MTTFRIIHHVDQANIDRMYRDYAPVFVLSTGRSGSKFIAALLNGSTNAAAFHEPPPTLQYFSHYAYHHQWEEEILTRMVDAARMEFIMETFIKDKIYIESNQCLTFFAPMLAKLFKSAKFVHLLRHPGDFVRSAVRKGWHRNDSIWESGRVKAADKEQWSKVDHIERLSWLWQATNAYIEDFRKSLQPGRSAAFKFEDLTRGAGEVERLLEFTGAEAIAKGKIEAVQGNRINELHIHPGEPPTMKKVADYPPYREWDEERQGKLKKYCAELAAHYGYEL